MNIILLGPPGSGKGTQSNNLVEKYKLSHISTGDILRSQIAEKTKLGNAAKVYMDKGDLVPDNLIIDMVSNTTKTLQSILLDGFPRTIPQAQALDDANIGIDLIIEIQLDDENIIERMSGRRVHISSGRNYHVKFNPPKKEGFDDLTGEELIQRDDDKEEVIRKRMDVYNSTVEPVLNYYQEMGVLTTVSAENSVETVYTEILNVLN